MLHIDFFKMVPNNELHISISGESEENLLNRYFPINDKFADTSLEAAILYLDTYHKSILDIHKYEGLYFQSTLVTSQKLLYVFVKLGLLTHVQDLYNNGIELTGNPSIIWAAPNKKVEEFLVRRGISPIKPEQKKIRSVFQQALSGDSRYVKKMILKKMVPIGAVDEDGKTLLYYAELAGRKKLINFLKEHGAR